MQAIKESLAMYANETSEYLRARAQRIQREIEKGEATAAEQREIGNIFKELDRRERAAKSDSETRGVSHETDRGFDRYLRVGDTSGMETRTTADGLTGDGSGTSYGGYTVPEGFWQNLQVAMKDYQGIAADFKMVSTSNGAPMPWPTNDPTDYVASLQGDELTQLDVDDSWVFGQGSLGAFTYACPPVLVSHQLAQDSAFDIGAFLATRFAEGIGRAQSAYAITGTGSGEPQGIVTGLTAKGAVSTGSGGFLALTAATPVCTYADPDGSATTELNSNSLSPTTITQMIASVDPAYRRQGAAFYVNDAQLKGLRNVTDTTGRPILQDPAHESGEPTLYGYPVRIDQSIGDLTASTISGPMFGAASVAMVERRVNGINVQRLDQRWGDYLAVGYLAWMRSDFRCNDLRAMVVVKANST